MKSAHRGQKFQDWFTQQWAILWGRKISPEAVPWLMGPFGQTEGIADRYIDQLAADQGLIVERNVTTRGLIADFSKLNLSTEATGNISRAVVDFYENTSKYNLKLSVEWNPIFKVFGKLTNMLFSRRIGQLNIPLDNTEGTNDVNSEIITLSDPISGDVKYTIWYRTLVSTGQVVYSGIYSTCNLPSGHTCIKAVFPLPNGNATVIMGPSAGPNGALQLNSSGNGFGEPGFYFLLNDSSGSHWAQYIRSFRDQLTVYCKDEQVLAEQTLTLWNWRVVKFNYEIQCKEH